MKKIFRNLLCLVCALATCTMIACGGGGGDNDNNSNAFDDFKGDLPAFDAGTYRETTFEALPAAYTTKTAEQMMSEFLASSEGGALVATMSGEVEGESGSENATCYYLKESGEVKEFLAEDWEIYNGDRTFLSSMYANQTKAYYLEENKEYPDDNEKYQEEIPEGASLDSLLYKTELFFEEMYTLTEATELYAADEWTEYVSGTLTIKWYIDDSDVNAVNVKVEMVLDGYTLIYDGEYKEKLSGTSMGLWSFNADGEFLGCRLEMDLEADKDVYDGTSWQKFGTGTEYSALAIVHYSGTITPPKDLASYPLK